MLSDSRGEQEYFLDNFQFFSNFWRVQVLFPYTLSLKYLYDVPHYLSHYVNLKKSVQETNQSPINPILYYPKKWIETSVFENYYITLSMLKAKGLSR